MTNTEENIHNTIALITAYTHTVDVCTRRHMDRELHLHLLMLCPRGDVENYRERTLVASISSLVSKECDLKGRRMKRDKLFSTTVNRRKL